MARTLKTTGLGPLCTFCLAVDDNGTTIKEFVSSDVNANMVIESGVTVHTDGAWGALTVPYFQVGQGADAQHPVHITFPTGHRPNIDMLTTGDAAVYAAALDLSHTGDNPAILNAGYGWQLQNHSGFKQQFGYQTSNPYSNTTVATATAVSIGAQRVSNDNVEFWYSPQGTAFTANDGVTTTNAGLSYLGDITEAAGTYGDASFTPGKFVLIAAFSQNLTLSQWNELHSDPLGALFEGGSPTTRTVTANLVDAAGSPLASLTGLEAYWYDEPPGTVRTLHKARATGKTTDGSGVFTWDITSATSQTNGHVGTLEVIKSDGTVGQSGARAFVGPAALVVT